ncbi:other/TTK protein kinase [Mycena floridula]|nr:other/TTK protein kinase [Mycena floridula]
MSTMLAPPPPAAGSPSSPSSDDSIDDLSFDYVWDDDGNFVRKSKGSTKSNHSTPPTPSDSITAVDAESPLSSLKGRPNSTFLHPTATEPLLLNSPVRRGSLSRSESAFPVLLGPATATSDRDKERIQVNARSFHRVASGPANLNGPSNGLPRRTFPRRITLEEQQDVVKKKNADELRVKLASSEYYSQNHYEEKENMHRASTSDVPSVEEMYGDPPFSRATTSTFVARSSSSLFGSSSGVDTSRLAFPSRTGYSSSQRPLVDSHRPRQLASSTTAAGSNRPQRILKGTGRPAGFERIAETSIDDLAQADAYGYPSAGDSAQSGEDTDIGESQHQRGQALAETLALNHSGGTRPRRSASLSDALSSEDYYRETTRDEAGQSRPSHQREYVRPGTSLGIRGDIPARRVTIEERDRQTNDTRAEYKSRSIPSSHSERQSPSPTHGNHEPAHGVSRPTHTHRRRDSDTLRNVPSTYLSGSPTVNDHYGVPAVPARMSPSAKGLAANINVKHRRSPTAPEAPTTSSTLYNGAASGPRTTWAAGDRSSGEVQAALVEKDRGRERPRAQTQPEQQVPAARPPAPQATRATPTPPTAAQVEKDRARPHLVVNRKAYARLDLLGKGGSSRVFRVMNPANELYAIKRVSLDKTDPETMSGYMNEIALLKRLDGNSRIIRLIDSEVRAGPGGTKGHLLLVMECGEIDLARLLSERAGLGVDMVWIAYYWQQMLQAVHVIHEEKIVHSDLKPANFVLVKGQLKLIDFGIANAIANDTTNIQRDHQIGTVNYMSPEAIELPDGMRRLKVGRPSDIWSLGCILYQMAYGSPPFQHLSVYQKMKAIPDDSHEIDYPEYSVPSAAAKGSPKAEPNQDQLKWRVRSDVIANMKSCLCRNPKERKTIPELLSEDWLAMTEHTAESPKPSAGPSSTKKEDLLAHDETIINPYYMRQLLKYGISLGQSDSW